MSKLPRKPVPKPDATFQFLVALPKETVARLDSIAEEMSVPRVALVRLAVEAFLAERGEEKLSVELPDDLRLDLMALRDALDGASVQVITEKSLRRYINYKVDENKEINALYQESRERHATHAKVVQFHRPRSHTK